MIYLAPIMRFRGEHWFWGCEVDASDMRVLEKLNTPEEILEQLELLEPRRVA
jgi:hypothetical protein